MKLPRIAEPLRHRDFRLLWLGQTLTLVGTFVSNVAYPFQLLQLGGSAVELGTLVAIYTATNLLFLLVGGAVADRVPRRTLIIVTELASGSVVAAVAALGATGTLAVWHLYVAYAYFGAATAFSVPALAAILPELVPEDILVPGNAMRGMSLQIARVAGPVAGGSLVAVAGPPSAFAVDALTFFGSAAFVMLTGTRALAERQRASMLADIREGLTFVFSVQWLWVTIFGWALVNAADIGALVVALPLLVTGVLGAGAATYGIITAAMGVGEAIGGAVIAQVRIRRSGIAMYAFGVMGGASLALFGLVPTVAGAVSASLVFGVAASCFNVLWQTTLQKHVPRALLGRVVSVDWFGGTLLGPVAPLAAAAVVQASGPASFFVVAGAAAAGITALGFLFPSIRELE